MSGNEYAVYDIARSKSHQSADHILFFDGREMAAEFATMSKSTAYNIAHSLEEKGWFKLIKAPSRRPTDGTWSATHYKVLSHQEWEEEHPNGCPIKRNLKKSPVQSEETVTGSPVQIQAQPVQKSASRVQPEGHIFSNTLSNNLSSHTYTDKGMPVQFEGTVTSGQEPEPQAGTGSAPSPVQSEGTVTAGGGNVRIEAARLATALTRDLGVTATGQLEGWLRAIEELLRKGNSSEAVRGLLDYTVKT